MRQIESQVDESSLQARIDIREQIEILRNRVSLLAGKDKLLMTMHLEHGITCKQLANLAGIPEKNITRKIHRIVYRLTKGEYIICLRNCEKFTLTEIKIARDYFLRGLSLKAIAQKRSASYYCIRETVKRIKDKIKKYQRKGAKE